LTAETGASITILAPDGKASVILRANLESLSSTGKSAMPEGLEKELKPKDLADVLAFLRAARPPQKPKIFAGNNPTLIKADAKGELRLLPGNASIFGPTLELESHYGNLGNWSSPDDRAEWEVEVPRAGKFAVWFDWACARRAAGNSFVLSAGATEMTAKVASTGSWDNYKQAQVGILALEAGRRRLVMRSSGAIKVALIDLRKIRLIPLK
jgi:hypothetical protein